MTKLQHDKLSVDELDRLNVLLDGCLTVSELLWDSEDTSPETSTRAGVMLTKNIMEIQGIVRQTWKDKGVQP